MELSKKVGYIKGLMAGLKIDDSTPEGQVLAAMTELLEEMAEEIEINSDIIDNVTDYIDALEEAFDDCEDYCDEDCCDDECCCGEDCCDDCYDEVADELKELDALEDFESLEELASLEEPADSSAEPVINSAPQEAVSAPAHEDVLYECVCPVCGQSVGLTQSDIDRGSINCPGCAELLEFE